MACEVLDHSWVIHIFHSLKERGLGFGYICLCLCLWSCGFARTPCDGSTDVRANSSRTFASVPSFSGSRSFRFYVGSAALMVAVVVHLIAAILTVP